MFVVLLKLIHDNGSQVPLIVDAKVKVDILAVVRREDVASRRGDCYLWEALIPSTEKTHSLASSLEVKVQGKGGLA